MTDTDETETIRAGDADIIIECGAAADAPETEIDQTGPEAQLGRAAHGALEPWVDAGCEGEPDPQPAANEHGADVKAVEELIAIAPGALAQIREDLSTLKAEVRIEGGGIRGRIDALAMCMAGHKLFGGAILDWKTGRDPDGGKPMQRLAYASACEATYGMPAQGYWYTAEIWLATGDIIESRFDIDSINGFRARLADQLKYRKFSPGNVCKYCRRRYGCPGRDHWIRSAVTALAEFGPDDVTVESVAALWDQSRALKRAIEHYEQAVDALIDAHGGITLPDFRRLYHGEKTLEKIDPQKAWPVMRAAGLSNDEINAIVSIGKTRLLDAVATRAPRGKKGETKAALVTKLDEAGAISRTKQRYRKILKPQ